MLEPWPDGDQPRLAGVSAFGFGGSNAHVVLEEAPSVEQVANLPNLSSIGDRDNVGESFLLPLSARTEAALRDLARRYIAFLSDNPPPWHDVCFTAAVRRDHHDCRVAILAQSAAEACDLLAAYLEGGAKPGIFSGRKPFGRNAKIAFVYDDSIEGWQKHGCGLLQSLPGFRAALENIDETLQRILQRRLSPALEDMTRADGRFQAPALVALQVALTAWCQNVGVTPDVVLGAGMGELAAACAAGILAQDDVLGIAADGELREDARIAAGQAAIHFFRGRPDARRP